jgi:hypothetical protein
VKLFKLITLVILTSSFITLGGCGYTAKIVSAYKVDTSYVNNLLKYVAIEAKITEGRSIYVTITNNSNQPLKTPFSSNIEISALDSSGNYHFLEGSDGEYSSDYPDYINPGKYVVYQRYLPWGWKVTDVKGLYFNGGYSLDNFNGPFKRINP